MTADKVAVVTGGGSGLGRHITLALAGAGWRVAASGRRLETLKETAALAPDETVLPIVADVADAGSVDALAAALQVPFEALLAQRNHIGRGGKRVNAVRSRAPHGSRRLGVTDHLLALLLRGHLKLPAQAVGVLLGVDRSTVSHATTRARELLAAARITLPAAPPPENPPRTPAGLLAYAAAAGIPLTIPENRYTMPDQFRKRGQHATRDTPETAD